MKCNFPTKRTVYELSAFPKRRSGSKKSVFGKKKKVCKNSLIKKIKNGFFQKSAFFELPITQKRSIFEYSYVSYGKRQKGCTLIVI